MQISSNHSGFNFSSVYKSVVTRQMPAPEAAAIPDTSFATNRSDEEKSDALGREALLLKAAHRVAERTANELEALPDL